MTQTALSTPAPGFKVLEECSDLGAAEDLLKQRPPGLHTQACSQQCSPPWWRITPLFEMRADSGGTV